MAKVLIVDESSTIRIITSYMLKALKITPIFAESAEEALNICATEIPDAVIIDWNLHSANGPSFRLQLKDLTRGYSPKVIVCTGAGDFNTINAELRETVDGFMAKPYDLNTLSYNLEKTGILPLAA